MSSQPVTSTPVSTASHTAAFNALIDQAARQFISSLSPQAIRAFNGRLDRGLELAKRRAVKPLPIPNHPHRYAVRSSDGIHDYIVDLDTRTCDCPDSLKGHTCKHRVAAYYYDQACQGSVAAQPEPKPAPASDREAQIMQELGFGPAPKKVKENHKEPALFLGSLFRQALKAEDLKDKPLVVSIVDITCVKASNSHGGVTNDTWQVWVKTSASPKLMGIPLDYQAEDELVSIFGEIALQDLKAKTVEIYPQSAVVHFRGTK